MFSSFDFSPPVTNLEIEPHDIHCKIKSDLTHIPLHEFKKNKHWWSSRPRYYLGTYQIKVIVDAAHIQFKLWHNGRNYTKSHSIAVEWGEASKNSAEGSPGYARGPLG
jgi:hypothetical protein